MTLKSLFRLPRLVFAAALLCAFCLAAVSPACAAESFRYSLATQQEYGLRRGFRLGFEDNSGAIPRKRENLNLVFGVADGKTWHYLSFKTAWQWNHDYQIKAEMGAQKTTLWVDGQIVKAAACAFAPAQDLDVLKAGLDTRRDTGATEYLVHQTALRLFTSKNQRQNFVFATPDERPATLFAFDPQSPVHAPWKTTSGETITLETAFRLREFPDVKAMSPFVDRYGQSRHAEWAGKLHSDAEIQKVDQNEQQRNKAWGKPADYDEYGGYTKAAGWNEKPTGFFRTVKRDGMWWFVSPQGNPCFYIGVDTVIGASERTSITGREYLFEGLPPESGAYAEAWDTASDAKRFGFTTANLIRKYGKNWENAAWQQAGERLKVWGFSGVGKWSGIPSRIQVPACQVVRRADVPKIGRMPDIFDGQVRAIFRASLEKSITPNKNNPFLVGWSLGNEHDEIVLKSDIETMMQQPGTVPAKHALVEFALQHTYKGDTAKMAAAWKTSSLEATDVKPPADDIEVMRRYFAENYYDFVYKNIKEIDPNHLYMGFWIGIGWWENEEDWHMMARHCDVIGYDAYGFQFSDARQDRLMKQTDKPVFCGEFSYPSWYNGKRGLGVYGTATASDAESGKRYADLMDAAARNPYCIGMLWFQYRDQPITGRGAKGDGLVLDEHYAFGLVDITDQPKWDMIAPMRDANLRAPRLRLQASPNGAKKISQR